MAVKMRGGEFKLGTWRGRAVNAEGDGRKGRESLTKRSETTLKKHE